jgi:hypothetical protein
MSPMRCTRWPAVRTCFLRAAEELRDAKGYQQVDLAHRGTVSALMQAEGQAAMAVHAQLGPQMPASAARSTAQWSSNRAIKRASP